MTRNDWLTLIRASGKKVYPITTDKPQQLSENLRRGARLRGWNWTFATKEHEVIVYVKGEA